MKVLELNTVSQACVWPVAKSQVKQLKSKVQQCEMDFQTIANLTVPSTAGMRVTRLKLESFDAC